MSKDRRDKSEDTKPGGPDQRLDLVDWYIQLGQWDDAERLATGRRRQLSDNTDVGLKLSVRLPGQFDQILRGRNTKTEPAVADETGVPGDLTEDQWLDIDNDARRRVYRELALGGDPLKIGNRIIDDLADDVAEEYGVILRSDPRKRLVRKVRDHVDRWQRKHGAA